MKLIGGRHGYATAHDMYELLGVTAGALPAEGIPEQVIQGVRVYVKPLEAHAVHTSCKHCGLDIEGISPFKHWLDRGGNWTCHADGRRLHKPYGRPRRNWQGLRVMAICECGQHMPVGRMHQHRCKEVAG